MRTSREKLNQILAREREEMLLYIVNLDSPYEGWGPGEGEARIAWSADEHKDFTWRLREATEKHWPELWQSIENENTPVEQRAWEIVLRMRTYLRNFWQADNERARDWHIHRAREYYQRLQILPELLKYDGPLRDTIDLGERLLDQPPRPNPIEKALYELQKRARKKSLAPRVCANECEGRYFLSTKKGMKYCPDCRRSQPQRDRASKLRSYHNNKDKWREGKRG
jgi:hypothetical protein